ncbi:hypothetical protein CKO31_01185 [Thiohalocapsa halophila]|uniref:Zorya protein ZorC EH domain-containing protein n=2 Tax=Thiohalocapsa halophila TaxID=69359 RepID=A0ABS1CC99_9GAMM|nr:hypothetical protein [Thiohalocapsa halophila]
MQAPDAVIGLLARVRRWLGRDLPPRTLELRFAPTSQRRQGRRPPLTPEAAHEALGRHSTTPEAYLTELLSIAAGSNHWPLSSKRRMALLESLTGWFYVAAAPALVQLLHQGSGIPEPPLRRETLELQDRCATALVEGYRIVFSAGYQASNFSYCRARARVYRSACRLLELIKLRQRIAGVRYMELESDAWRLAHTVFAAMRTCEPADKTLDALSLRNQALDHRTQASLRQHYTALATYGILDYSAWPEHEQLAIDRYSAAVPDAIRVLDYDPEREIKPWHQFASCYDQGPPARHPPEDERHGPTLLLDHHELAAHIRADARGLLGAVAKGENLRMPPRLARVDADQRMAVAYLLQRNLRLPEDWPDDWADATEEAKEHRDLRIYVGFEEVRNHLRTVFRRDHDSRLKRSRELTDLFAKHSAMIGEDDSATRRTLWYVLRDSQDGMRIRTQETRFTNRMFVGNLLAYGFGDEVANAPRIGKVNRIYRPVAGIVMLDIDYLASFAAPARLFACRPAPTPAASGDVTAAAVTEDDLMDEPLTCLLTHHPQQGWGIITPPAEGLWQQSLVCLRMGRRYSRARLGDAQDVTDEFYRFQVSSAGFPDKPPRYPQVAARASIQAATDAAG